jgi:broad specificity phosphatase PhoE
MKIFLVRHGLSKGNVDKSEYFKNPDHVIELAEHGKTDAREAAEKIHSLIEDYKDSEYPQSNVEYFNIIHSTYMRATQTANIIQDRLNEYDNYSVQTMIPSPLCIEREWGSLRDIVESEMKTNEHFNFYYRPLNGESFCDVYKRAAIFHQWLLNTSKYENNIVVAHGEFNKVYLMHLLNWDVSEFDKWRNARNGEVFLIKAGKLSNLTPLSRSKYF